MVPQSQSAAARYRIADLVLDTGTRQVSRGDESLKLGALTFDLLQVLAESAPNYVSHDQLVDRVWQGRPASPETITQRVSLLRDALSDNAADPRYIELLRGKGYRLIADVERLSERTEQDAQRRFLRFVTVATIAVAGLFFLGMNLLREDPQPSIAVLPFVDMSAAGNQRHLADGIAEELINQLAGLDGLQVASRTASFGFRDLREDLQAIGSRLGVDNVLEGSVQRRDDEIRVTVQLVDTRNGYHLWSETFDREVDDIFAIQTDIAMATAGALGVTLGVGGANAFAGAGTDNFDAYEAYLQRNFALATQHDPNYAAAWGRLGVHTAATMWNHPPEAAPEILERAASYAERALELDPQSARALSDYATLLYPRFQWLEAERVYAQALALRRDRPLLAQYSFMLMRSGRISKAQAINREADAIERTPRNPGRLRNFANIAEGNFEAARAMAERLRERRRLDAHVLIALNDGETDDVRRAFEAMLPNEPARIELYMPLLEVLESPQQALAIARQVLDDPSKTWPDKYHDVALVAAYFGDPELALEAFAREMPYTAARYTALWYPVMAEARRLPQFKQLVTDANLVEYWRVHGWADACRPIGDQDFACR